jgi:hypothetical protein
MLSAKPGGKLLLRSRLVSVEAHGCCPSSSRAENNDRIPLPPLQAVVLTSCYERGMMTLPPIDKTEYGLDARPNLIL